MIPASRRRLALLYVLVAAMLAALGGRLWYLQVMNTGQYKALAAANQTRQIVVPAVRGDIVDDTGNPLVRNRTAMVVSVNMMLLAQTTSDGGQSVLRRLAPLLGTSYTLLSEQTRLCTRGVPARCWPGSPYQPIPVAQGVSMRTALQIMEEPAQFPGVTAGVQPVVDYPMPDGANPAQVLGYLQPITAQEMARAHMPETGFAQDDLVGQAGLEAQYNTALTGTPGTDTVSVNAAGGVTGTVSQSPPKNGDTLVTSLNSKVQAVVQDALDTAVAKMRAQGRVVNQGAAVVETTTGRILAMASFPDYNPNVWTGGISQSEVDYLFGLGGKNSGEPAMNWATMGQWSPGSTFKITTASAAVGDGFSVNGLYNCPAAVNIDGHSFINDGNPNLGYMSLQEALIQSCDTVFYEFAYQMWLHDNNAANYVANPNAPIQKMQKMELDFGFGNPTGIDLPSENTGDIPTRQWLYYMWKDNAHTGQNWCKYGRANGNYVQQIEYDNCQTGYVWEPGQAAIAAIGNGYVNVTPLQLANAYTALADGGTLYAPRIGEALLSPGGKVLQRISPPVIRRLPVASSTLAYIRNALDGVITQGTAAGAFAGFPLNKVCVAGKTGTAQVQGQHSTSVFASFAPCQHPKFVVVVFLPNSGYGASAAAPAVRQIWDGIYGLEGHKAALPGGVLPAIPTVVGR